MDNKELFPPQREVIRKGLLDSNEHLFLNMATGSGKTYLAELAMEKVLREGYKAIYLTPLRAIAAQQYEQWKKQYPDTKIGIFTGETLQASATGNSYTASQILIMTPERLDACMRNWRSHWDWIPELSLLVIDEFHILGQPQRGPRLEGTITRLIRLNPFLRIVALSATMPNTGELADWLKGASFTSHWRQVPLEKKVIRFKAAKEKPELLLAEVRRCIDAGGQSLVFCNSRSRAQGISAFLLENGIEAACHHAGLGREKRAEVELNYRTGGIRALVATSTLEMGLNLPARQVVVYDSYSYQESGFEQLPVWSFIQRAGRAGRPGLDENGEVILMLPRWGTGADEYLRGDCEPIRSQLIERRSMQEQLLIDVFAGYSRTREELSLGFLPITLYKEQHPEATVNGVINQLLLSDLLTETEDGSSERRILRCGLLGRLTVKLMLAPETVKLIEVTYQKTDRFYLFDLLLLAAMTTDVSPVLQADYEEMDALCERVRSVQSSLLALSLEQLRKRLPEFPPTTQLLSGIKMAAICHALTQGASVEGLAEEFDEYEADITMLKESMIRVLLGITVITSALDKAWQGEEFVKERKQDPAYVPNLSNMLADMLQYEIGSELLPLTRLKGVGGKTAKRLAEAGYDTLQRIAEAEPERLSRIPGVGKKLAQSMVAQAPGLLPDAADNIYKEEPYTFSGDTRIVSTSVDPYRHRRSLELRIKGRDGGRSCVTGGREDHIVLFDGKAYVCDCKDFEKNQGDCKHILCVRRAMGDTEVCRMVKRIREDKNHSLRESLSSLWYSTTAQ